MIRGITSKQIQYIAKKVAGLKGSDLKVEESLEECVGKVCQRKNGRLIHKTLSQQSAVLFYSLVKKRPFESDNKQIALVTLFAFLFLNKKWLKVDKKKLDGFFEWISTSPNNVQKETIAAADKFIQDFIHPVRD